MGLNAHILLSARTKDEFFSMVSREQKRRNPVEPFVCLAGDGKKDKIKEAQDRMLNRSYKEPIPY